MYPRNETNDLSLGQPIFLGWRRDVMRRNIKKKKKTASKTKKLTAQPQFRDSLSHFILVPHKALVHAAILSRDRHHGNTFPGNRPYASARSQWLAVLQPVQRRLRKSTCAARLKSSLEKKGLDENGVLGSRAPFLSFRKRDCHERKKRASSRNHPWPPPKNRIIPWIAASEQFADQPTSRFRFFRSFAVGKKVGHRRGRKKCVGRGLEIVDYQMSGFPEINGLDRWLDVHV